MLTKLAEIYNRQDIVDDHKSYQVRIIKRRSYIVNHDNRTEYYIDNKLHRDNDKPAREWSNGSKSWWQNGKLHRDNDKPAVEYSSGTKWWFQNDKLHRNNDKPAVEWSNGSKEWWQNDVFIRSSEN